ncbi:MAG: hypothetical protein KAK00_00540 [Nanoarchaeota archaeon]|nr:hypothetical protein [Nanoarchaeota archaeon]
MAFTEYILSKRERMAWKAESTYGTAVTVDQIVGLDCAITPDFSKGWQEILTAGADNLKVQSRIVAADILPYVMNFTPHNWRWLKYLMAVSDGDDSGIKTHTFTIRNTILSYTMEWQKRHTTSHVITLDGNFVKSATMSWTKATGEGKDGLLKVSMNCVAQGSAQGSSATSVSAITDDPFLYRNCKLTLETTEIPELNNGEMTIDLGITEEDSRYCNSTLDMSIGEPIPGTFRVSGRFNVNIKDKTYYDMWVSEAVLTGTNTLLFDRDGTGDDQILFTFSGLIIHKGVAPTKLEGGATNVDLIWTAYGFTSVVSRDAVAVY